MNGIKENILETRAILADNVVVQEGAAVGFVYREGCGEAVIGKNSFIRSGAIIYGDVQAAEYFQTGHNVVIREKTKIGSHVLVGTGCIIDGQVEISDFVKLMANCYIPTHTRIGTRVFIGPNVVLTNDRYPLKMREHYKPEGPVIEDLVTLGGGVVVVPGVTIGRGSFVAAGAVVTKDVPPYSFVKGCPGLFYELPEKLKEKNIALNWREHIHE